MISLGALRLAVACTAGLLCASAAHAEDAFALEGTYTQLRPCRPDGNNPRSLLVKITPDEITYSGGVCAIGDRRQDGARISLRATCKNRTGLVLSGDITFTIRDDKTLDMVDQDNNYTAVLHKCPG